MNGFFEQLFAKDKVDKNYRHRPEHKMITESGRYIPFEQGKICSGHTASGTGDSQKMPPYTAYTRII